MDLVAIDLARLANVCEGGGIGLHGGPVTTQVDYLLVEPQPPLMLPTISCMDFFEHSGPFINYDASERCLVKTSFEQLASFQKEA